MPDHDTPEPFLAPATTPPKPARATHLDYPDPPPTPGERAKWEEHVLGLDPKCGADRRRDRALGNPLDGAVYDGTWTGRMSDATRELVRGPAPGPRDDLGVHMIDEPGVDDDVPALPAPVAGSTLRPRWEAFCRLYAFGHSTADAARHAGYAWDSAAQTGWRLLQDARIQERIAELQAYHAQALVADERATLVRAEAVYREAMNRGHYGAAVRALEFAERLKSRRAAENDEKSEAPGG